MTPKLTLLIEKNKDRKELEYTKKKRLYKNSMSKIVQTQLDEYDCNETNTHTAYEILGKKA